ncbi:MAG: hypothetical protein LBE03_02445 [Candidatus Nomurabacteria bacterium]|nr:hypothetical protein [Candidatus Nomurabacteria bacterium]
MEKLGYNKVMSERMRQAPDLETYHIPQPNHELSTPLETESAQETKEAKSQKAQRLEQLRNILSQNYENEAQNATSIEVTPAPETLVNTDTAKRQRLAKTHLADTIKAGGVMVASAVPLVGLGLGGAMIGAAEIGATVGSVAAIPILMAGTYKLLSNTISYRPHNTHTRVRYGSHTLEQGLFESISATRSLPRELQPVAITTEILNLGLNLPSEDKTGKPITYKMHTHKGIISNLERIKELGLVDISAKQKQTIFKNPKKSRLILEKLTAGAIKVKDLFKLDNYQDDGILRQTDIYDVSFTVNKNQHISRDDFDKSDNRTLKTIKKYAKSGKLDISYDNDGNLQYVNIHKKHK